MSKFKHLLLIMTDWGKSYLGWMHFTNFKLDRFQVSQSWPRFQICHLLNHLREDELESRHLVEVRDVVLKNKVIVWKIISLKGAEFFTLQIFSDKVSFYLSVAWLLPVVERLYDGDLDVVFRGYELGVTRFGEISPLWQNVKIFRNFLRVYWVSGKLLNLLWKIQCAFGANLNCCQWPNIEQTFWVSGLPLVRIYGHWSLQ